MVRMSSAVAVAASRTSPAPRVSTQLPFGSWSAPSGRTSRGTPCASAPVTDPDPPWFTTRSTSPSTESCGTYCSIRIAPGPSGTGKVVGLTQGPVVRRIRAGRAASASMSRANRSPDFVLNSVPSVT